MQDKPKKPKPSRLTGRNLDKSGKQQFPPEELRDEEKRPRGAEPGKPGEGKGDDEKPPDIHYTPFLVICYCANDVGLRPLSPGEAFWASPDIWIESSDPMGQGVPGEDNFVHAVIHNLGLADAAPVKVDFYWGNPALGLNAAAMNLIGTEWVIVPGLQSKEVRCNTAWVPVYVNQGHECLMVNCTNYIADPITAPFQPWLDRHVGQRNVHVLPAKAGQSLKFRIEVINLFPLMAQVEITARTTHLAFAPKVLAAAHPRQLVAAVLGHGAPLANVPFEMQQRFQPGTAESRRALSLARFAATRQLDVKKALPVMAIKSGARIKAKLSEEFFIINNPDNPGQFLGNLLLAADKLTVKPWTLPATGIQLGQAMMQPFELRHLDLELGIPTSAREGEFLAFHLNQQAAGLNVGGYTVVVRVQ